MTLSVWEKLDERPTYDFAITAHHFTPYLRDYEIILDFVAPLALDSPLRKVGGSGSYIGERFSYRFTHCVMALVETAVMDHVWRESWSDIFTDYQAWEQAGMPEGYVWGVGWSLAYPGMKFIKDSSRAKDWTERLQQPMYELYIETNGHNITLVFHDVIIRQIAKGDPMTGNLIPLE